MLGVYQGRYTHYNHVKKSIEIIELLELKANLHSVLLSKGGGRGNIIFFMTRFYTYKDLFDE